MNKNAIAVCLILTAALGSMGELCGWLLPTVSWPFTASRELPLLSCPGELCPTLAVEGRVHWFGWMAMLLLALPGLYLLARRKGSLRIPPETRRRMQRFRALKRGWWALLTLGGILALAAMDQALVGKRALCVISHDGEWHFPAFRRNMLPGAVFGLQGNAAHAETDYRALLTKQGTPGGPRLVVMPPIAWDAATDAAPFPTEELRVQDGTVYTPDGKKLFDGQACRLYPNGDVHLRIRYRKGRPDGHVQGWSPDRREVYGATWSEGKRRREHLDSEEGSIEEFMQGSEPKLYLIHYHPSPPLKGGHLLGTDSQGTDIAALLFGGLQVNVKAAIFYLPVIYGIGLTLGMLMGYWGGKFDLLTQRGIEIISQLPFLFIVMILTDFVPLDLRGMFTTLLLLALFGWMPMTYLIRTATMREKARDYVAAARAMGAGPVHILRRHILPNLTSIIITLIPFSVAVVVLSLTSLDYLGFGLPETYPSWGRLLNDGLAKLSSPWIASSAFGALTIILLLITFIGEAVREAIDPKSGEHYK